MTLAPQDNVSFFTKLMVNIWSASSILTSQAGILTLGSGVFYLFVSKEWTQLFLTKIKFQSLLT